jgi:alpha-1,6-mannosyltransferase
MKSLNLRPTDQSNAGRGRVVRAIALGWSVCWLAAFIVALANVQINRSGSSTAGQFNLENLWPFWITSAGVWLGLTGIWLTLRGAEEASAGLVRTFRRDALIVLGIAVVARVAVLAMHEPSLSDDVYRYIFDGRNMSVGLNPYLVTPQDRVDAANENWPGEREIVDVLVYRELPSPYLPISHYAFGAMGLCVTERWSDLDSSARVYRIGFVLIELAMIGVLLLKVRNANQSAWWAALYAWHPLAISEIAGSGHQDVVGVALLVAAIALFNAKPQAVPRWSALLSLSGMVKPVAIPSAIFMLRGRPVREWILSLVVGTIVAIAIAIPLRWLPSTVPFQQWSITAGEMSQKWAHFAGVYEPVLFVLRKVLLQPGDYGAGWNLVQEIWARRICMAILVIAFGLIFRARLNVWKSTAAMMLAIVLLSPTAHPWYLLWALALCPLAMSRTLWIASLTIPWGYIVFATGKGNFGGEEWTVPAWTLAIAYGPVLIALTFDLIEWRRRGREAKGSAIIHA